MSARLFRRITVVTVLLAPITSWAAAKTCLTGTDSAVANDPGQIGGVRDAVQIACPCTNFDGSSGKTHGAYVKCASSVITAQVSAGALRSQCKATVKKYYAASTCGLKASLGSAPCVKTALSNGKITCSIKPSSQCVGKPGKFEQVACATFTHCLDAVDTNHDLVAAAPGDDGSCVDDATTMDQKMLMGYQGWFGCPGDGSLINTWFHWFDMGLHRAPPASRSTCGQTLPNWMPASCVPRHSRGPVVSRRHSIPPTTRRRLPGTSNG